MFVDTATLKKIKIILKCISINKWNIPIRITYINCEKIKQHYQMQQQPLTHQSIDSSRTGSDKQISQVLSQQQNQPQSNSKQVQECLVHNQNISQNLHEPEVGNISDVSKNHTSCSNVSHLYKGLFKDAGQELSHKDSKIDSLKPLGELPHYQGEHKNIH